jgi:hypothetical protein
MLSPQGLQAIYARFGVCEEHAKEKQGLPMTMVAAEATGDVAAKAKGSRGSRTRGSSSSSAIVPVQDLAESLSEDGRLMRMFVAREQHLKSEAETLATTSWLIPPTFYQEWLQEFVKRYAPVREQTVDETLETRALELRDALQSVLKNPEKASVEALEACIRECAGDVYKLRDTLLSAVKNLRAPRRYLRRGDGRPMTQEAILALQDQRQVRLRDVVRVCLEKIHATDTGGEVLRIAMDSVRHMIDRFERIEDDISTAMKGDQWHQLKELMGEIEDKALPALEDEGLSLGSFHECADRSVSAEKDTK